LKIEAYDEILASCGGQIEVIDKRERMRLIQAWRECYAAPLHSARGIWKLDNYEWHVFSFAYTRAINGLKAYVEYQRQVADVLIVCPEQAKLPAVRIVGGRLPDFRPVGGDVYVWPHDLQWTMAFTHEESMGLGPYFSRSDWVVETSGVEAD
jgi:hypothetical protein